MARSDTGLVKVEKSEFDRRVFGCPVHRLTIDSAVDRTTLPELPAGWCFARTPVLPENAAALTEAGFRLITIRSTMGQATGNGQQRRELPEEIVVRQWTPGSPSVADSDFAWLTEVIGATSRYYKDPEIPRDIARRVFDTWLRNSLHEGYADAVFLACKEQQVVGWLSVRLTGADASIDLMGIREDHQRQGLGSALFAAADAWAGGRATDWIVATEAENLPAVRFYLREGFRPDAIELVYHRRG